jgi:DNA-binding beta-propeller fold protein YncE
MLAAFLVPVIAFQMASLSCGHKPSHWSERSTLKGISGFIHVTEISGRLGSKVMSRPGSLALDALGNLVICDTGNHRLVKVKPDGTFLTEVGGFGFSREEFNYPAALATSDGVNFHLLDSDNDRIVALDYDLNWIAEENLRLIQIDPPIGRGSGIAVSSFGDLFYADPDNNRVVRFDTRFEVISELTEPGGFLDPGALTTDRNNYLYVVDRDQHNIVQFDNYDNYLGKIGEGGLEDPAGICTDNDDLLYVIDRKVNTISLFTLDGKEVFSFGSTGVGQYQFRQAHSICVSREGLLFISDYAGDRVIVYRPSRS